MGRTIQYTDELGKKIADYLIEGYSIRRLSEKNGMPTFRSITRWANDPDHPFYKVHQAARILQAHLLADEIFDIADNRANNPDSADKVRRDRLMIDTRKWYLGKMLPKIYGDKVLVGNDPDNPLPAQINVNLVRPDESTDS